MPETNTMIDFIHRAKHWLLFIPLALPTLIQYGVQGVMSQRMQQFQLDMMKDPEMGAELAFPDLSVYAGYWYAYVAIMAVSFLVILSWYWSIGYGLKDRLPQGVNMDVGKFRIGFVVSAFAMGGIILACLWSFGYVNDFFAMISNDEPPEFVNDPDFLKKFFKFWAIGMIIGILYLVAFVYISIFMAKTLKSIELGKKARGSDVVGYVLLLFIPLIGVWILQPKINRLVTTGTMEKEGDGGVW